MLRVLAVAEPVVLVPASKSNALVSAAIDAFNGDGEVRREGGAEAFGELGGYEMMELALLLVVGKMD